MSNYKIYEIPQEIDNLMMQLDGSENDITIFEQLEKLQCDFKFKLEFIGKSILNDNGLVDSLKSETKRLQERVKILENRTQNTKLFIQSILLSSNTRKLQCNTVLFSIRKNPPKLEILDENQIPEDFIKTEIIRTIDKNAIKEQLKTGHDISGVQLVQSESLTIK